MRVITAITGALMAAAAMMACGGRGTGSGDEVLPPSGFLDGWQRTEDARILDGANLYGYINGGAEVFLELGFDRLVLQEYTSPHGSIQLELYRMTDPSAALGVYLMKCGSERPDPSLEARHTVDTNQLQMVTDSVYVVINVLEAEQDLSDALVEFARAVAERTESPAPPDVFAALPAEDRIPGSERVVRGPYTLEPLYTLGEGDILNLGGEVTAIAASYLDEAGNRITRILVPYPSRESARSAFAHLRDHLDPYLEVLASDPGRLAFKDYRDRYGEVVLDGSRIEITADLLEPPQPAPAERPTG